MGTSEIVARLQTDSGEVALRRVISASGDAAYELIVNGVFLMSSEDGVSERLLAEECLGALPGSAGLSVLVGGLGLGLTLRAVLGDPRVVSVHVAEIEAEVVRWNRGVLGEVNDDALSDLRVTVAVDDVRQLIDGPPQRYDAILLDVDNGPTWVTRSDNASLYDHWALRAMHRALRRPGVLGVWSDKPAPAFRAKLDALFDEVAEIPVDSGSVPIQRAGPDILYRALAR